MVKGISTLDTILKQFRDDARSNRDLGDRFERLILQYLQLDPLYVDRFSNVWMWNDWPGKGKVSDVGIDLVAQERATGEYCGIQCKFYLPEHTVSKGDLDSFFTALGKPALSAGLIVSTTDHWGKNAEDALNQTKPVTRLSLHDLAESPIDWSKFDARKLGTLSLAAKKKLRAHQWAALKDVNQGLNNSDRGKLIMACGTGKTFTALKIAETLVATLVKQGAGGHVLFLVPSLSLLSQTLREWTAESEHAIHSLAVCSDVNIGKRRTRYDDDIGEITIHDLAFPATTNANQLLTQFEALRQRARKDKEPPGLTVIFSTYQSIDTVSRAQKIGLPEFELIICDEAHRTTGVTLTGEDESAFVKVHDAAFLKGKKRIYMTATPRIYGDEAKSKAKEATAELASMDDETFFGKELHRLGFGEAVGKNLLADYKVLVLAVDEKYVSKTFQKQMAENSELNLQDAVKITGCWNGLAKRFDKSNTATNGTGDTAVVLGDVQPMRRAVAFSRSIKDSKAFVEKFGQIVNAYKENHVDDDGLLEIEAAHVDGTFDALRRAALLDWLKAESEPNTCRILSNARCLSEGVDVPALDAVLFLNPRNSVIDVVQSVGRVMRRSDETGKRYGYIILPVGIPADMKPEEALKNNEKYKVVWQVLQALRAHDDRFNATINQLELNRSRPDNIQVIGVSGGGQGDGESDSDSRVSVRNIQGAFAFPQLEEWKDAIYARMVLKVGDRAYWETWARDIAKIAETHITRIKAILDDPNSKAVKAFDKFLKGLQTNLNPAVSRHDAIEMLAQHLITRPVFDALFANYVFTERNPVSQSMQKMLDILHEHALEKETATLEKFYASVRDRAKGLDNAEARQKVVIELYDEFFRTAFPRMAERLGIVYTPTEVVDFIIHSVQDVLRDEFNSGLAEKDVHIIDPFTGTGTFLVRLLQSGFIPPDKLMHKYQHELHANEIVLLAYYIAAINIEETFHGLRGSAKVDKGKEDYLPFEGICLTDTFQLYESGQMELEGTFSENNKRVKRQKESPIRVVIANPPYSSQQESENDNNQNLDYPELDHRIQSTYAERSTSKLAKYLYSSEIRALRWASDRVGHTGIIGFVTNNAFLDKASTDGVRGCLQNEFCSVHIFNLRGYQRTSGETSKREGGKIFGGGSRNGIAIVLLVKNPAKSESSAIYYHDIGDYLAREDKLKAVSAFASIKGIAAQHKWTLLSPNQHNDWINQRDPTFGKFLLLGDKTDQLLESIFENYSLGVVTNRDAWAYNASRKSLMANIAAMTDVFNVEAGRFKKACENRLKDQWPAVEEIIDSDPKKISWTRSLKNDVRRGKGLDVSEGEVREALYRPFAKQNIFFSRRLNEMVYQQPRLFPRASTDNVAICVSSNGTRAEFSVIIADRIPDLSFADKSSGSQCFPLYLYEKADESSNLLFNKSEVIDGYRRRDAITDGILKKFVDAYGKGVTKEDIFYYVYGVLHSPEYRTRFAADLKKMLPRIPLTKETRDFRAFSQAGRELAQWHLNYETVEPWDLEEHMDRFNFDPSEQFKVTKMTFARPTPEQKEAGAKWDKTKIIYNSHVTLSSIPLDAFEYVVNGKPAIEWILERYQVTRDKDSGIVNDPNDWCTEHNQPRYIIDLLKRVVRVSMETIKIVKHLPALNERP